MVGYYWQTRQQLEKTIFKVRQFMFSGLARTLQVTLCTPLDFTPYHQECIDKKVLQTKNYNDFDMSCLIVNTPIPHDEYYNAIKKIYRLAFHPLFVLRQLSFLLSLKKSDWQFIFTYGVRAIRRVNQHIFNLTKNHSTREEYLKSENHAHYNHDLLYRETPQHLTSKKNGILKRESINR